MSECRIINRNNLQEEKIITYLDVISEKNESLSVYLEQIFHKKDFSGVREDVLEYLAGHAGDFKNDGESGFHIASFACNTKAGTEWYEWLNEYFSKATQIPIGDFVLVLGEAVHKGMSVENMKEIVDRDGNDIIKIYKEIDALEEQQQTGCETDSFLLESPAGITDIKKYESDNQINQNIYTDLFEGLLSAMNPRHYNESSSIANIQSDFCQICVKMEVLLREISSAATEMFHEWEKDKEEIGRLMTLYKLAQKMSENQQNRINEMCNEINGLNSKIQTAKQSEMRRDVINQKINELQHLTLSAE